jgi:LysR family transcriptional regulator, hydrogen peroxide-inducible genes activator
MPIECRVTLTELKYLIAVAEEQHFGRAAECLFVGQPSLSAAIKNIEEELGVRVFERSKRGVTLTDVGADIVAQARRTLDEAARIRIVAKQGKNRFRLRLGIIHTIAPYLLPQLVMELRKTAPDMSLDIEENMTANLDRLLRAGELDAAILALPYEAPGIEVEALYDEEFKIVVPLGHALARRRTIPVGDLDVDELLLLPVGHCLRDQVLGACTEFSRAPPPGRLGNSLETLRSMVASGLGITVLPTTALTERYHTPLIKAVPFAEPRPKRRIAVAWRKGVTRPAAVRKLIEAIRAADLPVELLGGVQ